MIYSQIDRETKNHIFKLLEWISNEVISAGGDGDFLWYSIFYDVNDILIVLEEFNSSLKFKWDLQFNKESLTISCSRDQEGFTITNSEERYKNAPSWQQGILKY